MDVPAVTDSIIVRPAPWAPPPEGHHYEAVEQDDWATPAVGAGRCRYGGGGTNKACGRPAVATLFRRGKPWDYCGEREHMYGCWVEDGKVMGWRLVEDEG